MAIEKTDERDYKDDLTDEELASLNDEESNDGEEDLAGAAGSGEEETIGDDSANTSGSEDGTTKPDDKGNDTEAPGRDDGGAVTEPKPTDTAASAQEAENPEEIKVQTPVLVAEAPAQAAERLKAIETEKDELIGKFDDGELTAREYQKAIDALGKEERQIERDIDHAELASKMQQQQGVNEWMNTVQTFLNDKEATGGRYQTSVRAQQALDAEVRDVASKPENQGLSGREILEKSHANLSKEFGWDEPATTVKPTTKPAGKTPVVKHPDPVPGIGKMPAAENNEPGESKFAALDRLQGEDHEAAIERLSPAERDAYLKAT